MSPLTLSPDSSSRLLESGLDIVITGASGWIGRSTLEMLNSTLGPALSARVHAFGSTAGTLTLRSGVQVPIQPLGDLLKLRIGPHLLAHYAFATREFVSTLGFSEYIRRNEAITDLVLAHLQRAAPAGIIYLSSGAVHLGSDLEINPYGVLKARDEVVFGRAVSDSAQSNSQRLVIPRLFNLAGPFLNKPDRFVLGSIINDVLGGGPVRLMSARVVTRSYVHVADLVELCFAILLGSGTVPSAPFDMAGDREVEVGELATIIAAVLGHPDMAIERPTVSMSDPDRYVGDGSTMRSLAHVYGLALKSLETQIEDTARFLMH